MIVSSKEDGPPSSATEIEIGVISTVLTRMSASPVTHMFNPPSISGQELSGGTSFTEVLSALERPKTRGDAEMNDTLAADGGEAGRSEDSTCPTEQGRHGAGWER